MLEVYNKCRKCIAKGANTCSCYTDLLQKQHVVDNITMNDVLLGPHTRTVITIAIMLVFFVVDEQSHVLCLFSLLNKHSRKNYALL